MVAGGFGFGFLPEHSIKMTVSSPRLLVDPEIWRNIHLVTVRDKPQSCVVSALVHGAMRTEWAKEDASPVKAHLRAN
jgi:hypothetical protein